MTSNIISIIDSTTSDITNTSDSTKLSTKSFTCLVPKTYKIINLADKIYIILGYIQLQQESLSSIFSNEDQFSSSIDRMIKLNGHFSLIELDKMSNSFRIYANKCGGARVYLRKTNNGWDISETIKHLSNKEDSVDQIAFEEKITYRWISGENSFIKNISQIPSAHYWQMTNNEILKKKCYFDLPFIESIKNNLSIKEHANNVQNLLSKSLKKSLIPDKKVAVLLSGGVDSSILAAIANKENFEVVAFSHKLEDHENHELDTAIEFARQLKIEHRIIPITDREISENLKKCTQAMEQAPRSPSDVLLYILLSKMSQEFQQVIYGVGADTLFGSGTLKRYQSRYEKQSKALNILHKVPFNHLIKNLLPKNSKLGHLIHENVENFLTQTFKLNIPQSSLRIFIEKEMTDDSFALNLIKNKTKKQNLLNDLYKIRCFSFKTDIENQFHESYAIAREFSLELVSPFTDIDILTYCGGLNIEQTISPSYVKPILRKIGEEFYSYELMHLPKKGFPAPYRDWLANALESDIVISFDELGIASDIDLDSETLWTITALGILKQYFNVPIKLTQNT